MQVYAVGARLIDLEQVLYYPGVVVYPPAARGWLVQYEYILNPDILDGRALNGKGEVFIHGFPARDEFIRAIGQEVKNGTASPHGGFYIDLSQSKYSREELTQKLEAWLHQFTNLKEVGIDLRDARLEMAPAAHYCLGGIQMTNMAGPTLKGCLRPARSPEMFMGPIGSPGTLCRKLRSRKTMRKAFVDYIDNAAAMGKSGGYRDAVLAEYDTICRWKEKKTGRHSARSN